MGRARVSVVLAGVSLAAAACAGPPVPAGSSVHWACTTLNSRQQYFRGYGTTREQAFDMAMERCRQNGADPITCIGSPDKCSPPSGG